MAKNEDKEVTIRVAVRKTVQEHQFEPFSLELECTTTCMESEREDETLRVFNDLEAQVWSLLNAKLGRG